MPAVTVEAPTWIEGMRLQAVDDVAVGLQQVDQASELSVPDEDMAAVRAAHHKLVTPEVGFLYLNRR